MNYLEFDFEVENEGQSEQLIALLNEQGFEGFEEEEIFLKAFIAEDKFDEKEFATVVEKFTDLVYTSAIVENINWNQQWEESFQPVIVENAVAIRAGFHQPITTVAQEIIITPKMSFGTGHHATTYLMIQQMLSINFNDKHVIDFGTGTGVLAILAEKRGASNVLAIDYDEWSIENAKENISQNHCTKILLEQNSIFPVNKSFDIILANITLNVISESIFSMAASAKKGSKLLLSGFLKTDEQKMAEVLKTNGLALVTILQKGNWISILANKN